MEQLTQKQQQVVVRLKERYSTVHPVLFHRIMERAKDEVELFDMLDTLPTAFPLKWDLESHQVITVKDILKR